jgi:hypothetical protein
MEADNLAAAVSHNSVDQMSSLCGKNMTTKNKNKCHVSLLIEGSMEGCNHIVNAVLGERADLGGGFIQGNLDLLLVLKFTMMALLSRVSRNMITS